MRTFIAVLLLISLVGCGSDSKPTPPPSGPTAPQPGPQASYGSWDASTVQAFNQYCASAGDPRFSYQQWFLYCDCIAQFAGANWQFDDFASNVSYYYYYVLIQPLNGGPSPDTTCLQKAGMLNGQGRPATAQQVRSAQIL